MATIAKALVAWLGLTVLIPLAATASTQEPQLRLLLDSADLKPVVAFGSSRVSLAQARQLLRTDPYAVPGLPITRIGMYPCVGWSNCADSFGVVVEQQFDSATVVAVRQYRMWSGPIRETGARDWWGNYRFLDGLSISVAPRWGLARTVPNVMRRLAWTVRPIRDSAWGIPR